MFCIVSYDISDDHRRTKVSHTLKDYGTRVQYSVFECLVDKNLLSNMMEKLHNIIEEDDSIRFYSLCKACEGSIAILGSGKVTKDEQCYIL